LEKGRDGKYDAPILVHRSTKEAGIGVGVGSLLNVLLDPLFMFVILLIPCLLLMNRFMGMPGLIWAQLVADFINTAIAFLIFLRVRKGIMGS